MKVVALISGGKDSLFSILHCLTNGHEVVALANLYPEEAVVADRVSAADQDAQDIEDIDSHMYQTVGHSVIPLYEQALGIPLYRAAIIGGATQRGHTYAFHAHAGAGRFSSEAPDETESLTHLLKRVKVAHPQVSAVSTGAILSTYQRTRVESVAIRLELTPLSFLWQYPYLPPTGHATLLHDMDLVGAEARIIKTSSGGLDVTHLWQNVADPAFAKRLEKDMGRFGKLDVGAILGEGGEYETLAVDGPTQLWKKRIEVPVQGDWFVSAGGGVARVVIKDARLIAKEQADIAQVPIPDLLDREWDAILAYCKKADDHEFLIPQDRILGSRAECSLRTVEAVVVTDNHVHLLNVSASPGQSILEQADGIKERLVSILQVHQLEPDDLHTVTVLLRSMSDFTEMNDAYKQLFSQPLPPSRITIACGDLLPPGVSLLVSASATKLPRRHRQGLHVQSQSYWAPANIGPYSQAISLPVSLTEDDDDPSQVVYIAGQIPLVPASMDMIVGPFEQHNVIALQHLWRIGRAMKVHWWVNGLAYITASSVDDATRKASMAFKAWERAVERPGAQNDHSDEDEDLDIGDLSLRQPWMHPRPAKTKPVLSDLPDWSRGNNMCCFGETSAPPCFVAQVEELPRGASIEWTGLGLALGRGLNECASVRSRYPRYDSKDSASGVSWTMLIASTQKQVDETLACLDEDLTGHSIDLLEAYVAMPSTPGITSRLIQCQAQVIPCHRLWSEMGEIILLLRRRSKDSGRSQQKT